jgi:probable rRNA maturation factor
MNEVDISVEGVELPSWLPRARGFALAVLRELGKEGWDLSILVCDDAFIQGLNKQYRDRDEPTDVLSFEQGVAYRAPDGGERWLAGDIAISLGGLARNMADFGVSENDELKRLIVHGVLHLSGYDHATSDASEPMLAFQEEVLRKLGDETIV